MKRIITYPLIGLAKTLGVLPRPHTSAVILAGGLGARMGAAAGTAKQWMMLGGKTVLERAVVAFEDSPCIDEIVVVVRRGEGEKTASLLRAMGVSKVRAVVAGGETRQQSAYRGACRVSDKTRYIAIHDAARCLIDPEDISAVVRMAYKERAASLGTPVTDTVKCVDSRLYVTGTKERKELWLAATPQVFAYPMYMGAAVSALRAGREVTDDNMLMESIGQRIRMVEARGEVLKITTQRDFRLAEAILAYKRRGETE